MIVYAATNLTNGKIYVGCTMQPLKARMAQHKCRAGKSRTAFAHAIAKYGMDGFRWEVIAIADSASSLEAAERYYIRLLNSRADGGHGYNRTEGGAGTAGMPASAETRAKQSEVRKRRNFGKFQARRQLPLFNGLKLRRHSPERIEQIRQSMMGRRHNAKVPLDAYPMIQQRFAAGESQRSIAEDYGVNRATISYLLARIAA